MSATLVAMLRPACASPGAVHTAVSRARASATLRSFPLVVPRRTSTRRHSFLCSFSSSSPSTSAARRFSPKRRDASRAAAASDEEAGASTTTSDWAGVVEDEPVTDPGTKPEKTKKAHKAYVRGQRGYSKFYPPEARNYKYERHLMVAVDGSKEAEQACEWAIKHLVRSGDLLHIVHVATPQNLYVYTGPPDPRNIMHPEIEDQLSPEAQDEYWQKAVDQTEAMLEAITLNMEKVAEDLADGGDAAPFLPPIELDAVLDIDIAPVAEVVCKKAKELDVAALVVFKHSKAWWQEALTGSVTKYLIDHSGVPVLVMH